MGYKIIFLNTRNYKNIKYIYKKFSYLKVNDFIYSYCYIQDIYVYNY